MKTGKTVREPANSKQSAAKTGWRAWIKRVHRDDDPMQPLWRTTIAVGVVAALIACLLVLYRSHWPAVTDTTVPFTVGTNWTTDTALQKEGVTVTSTQGDGYDGQWFLAMAYDPILHSTAIAKTFDAPRYRSERPLLSMLGWAVGLGQKTLIPGAILLVEVLAAAVGCMALARIAVAYRHSRWWGLLFLAVPGTLIAIAFGSSEALAGACAVVGLSLALDRRYWLAGLAFAGAALSKDVYVGFAVATAGFLFVQAVINRKPWFKIVAQLLLPSIALLGAWLLYVHLRLPPDPKLPNQVFAFPVIGWLQTLKQVATGAYHSDFPVGPLAGVALAGSVAVIVAALVLAVRRRAYSIFTYSAIVWCLYGLCLKSALLGRFLSSQRDVAAAVLAAVICLITISPETILRVRAWVTRK